MSSSNHSFLFSFLGSNPPSTAAKVHIRRLYDILQLCISRHDIPRAKRAWAILARCKEVDWKPMWRTAIHLLGQLDYPDTDNLQRVEFLGAIMRQYPEEQESILRELVLHSIVCGRHREALDELDLYLPSFPFQDNPVLHAYAGLLCIHLAQVPETAPAQQPTFNPNLLRDAQAHLERARALDVDNVVAQAFLDRIPDMASSRQGPKVDDGSEHEDIEVDDSEGRQKRLRS